MESRKVSFGSATGHQAMDEQAENNVREILWKVERETRKDLIGEHIEYNIYIYIHIYIYTYIIFTRYLYIYIFFLDLPHFRLDYW